MRTYAPHVGADLGVAVAARGPQEGGTRHQRKHKGMCPPPPRDP